MSVAEKYSELGFKLLPGSSSGPSYLVFGQDEKTGATVGAKLIMQGLAKGADRYVMVGLRIRMVADPEGKVAAIGKEQKYAEPGKWDKALPKFEWGQTNGIRRSMMVGVVLKRGPGDFWMTKYDLAKIEFVEKMHQWVQERLPRKSWAVNQEAFQQFLRESIEEAFSKIAPPEGSSPEAELALVQAAITTAKENLKTLEIRKIELEAKVATGAKALTPEDSVTVVEHLTVTPMTSDELNALLNGQPAAAKPAKAAKGKSHLKLVEDEDGDAEEDGDPDGDGDED